MLIDWFTVGAQVLNFAILVWLMKRFLYAPVLNAIAAREQRIAAELADAAARQAEASKERDELHHKTEEFDQQRAAHWNKVTDEANTERQRMLDEAHREADALRVRRQAALNNDQQHLHDEITRRTREEVFAIARKTLTDLAGASLELRMCDVFVSRCRELNGESKQQLAAALKGSAEPARLRSAFDLPAPQRASIQQALNETFAADIPLQFVTASDVVSGIELSANGCKVAWSIDEYLKSLNQTIDQLLKDHTDSKSESHAAPPPGPAAVTPKESK